MFAQNNSILCEMLDSTYNNTIKDTIVLEYSKGIAPFETIRREGTKYYAVTSDSEEEITSFINGKTRVLIKDGDGHELVIDKDGNVMGVEEYKKCGGSAKLLSEHNAYRDSTMSATANVAFSKIENENYGFDEWRGADYDRDEYDNFNGYIPAYICAQKQSSVKVKASQTKGLRFITERGVPVIANNADNTLTLNIGTTGKQSVYAYDADSALVGKLCVQAYDVKTANVHIVRINNAKMPNISTLQNELNAIFGQAQINLTINELDDISINLGHKFIHGGTRRLRAYNDDQRKVIDELKKRPEYDQNDFYLFFVDDIEKLDDDGNPTRDIIGGYMPVGWHFGFIYNNPRTAYIAHELGHGVLTMHHTFAEESETFHAPKESSDNLMDYNGGTHLNHKQWQWAHEKHSREWFEEEEEGEAIINMDIMRRFIKQIHDANSEYKETLALNISQGMNFAYSQTIELSDSVKMSYLSMSTYKNSSSYSSIKPYEKATKIESDSLTTYTFNAIKPKFGELPPICFTIKTNEKQTFEDYLYGKDIDISDKVQWVSQFDNSIFELCTGCWKSSCCRRACEYMLGNTNVANCTDSVIAKEAPYKTQIGKIVLASFSDNTKKYTEDEYNNATLVYDKNKIDEGFNYIKSELQARRPVLIGVHQTNREKDPPNNKNRATCHWMIVVGIGMEDGEKYIRFFDPGRSVACSAQATSISNKLKYNSIMNCFSGDYNNKTYTLTEIIKY